MSTKEFLTLLFTSVLCYALFFYLSTEIPMYVMNGVLFLFYGALLFHKVPDDFYGHGKLRITEIIGIITAMACMLGVLLWNVWPVEHRKVICRSLFGVHLLYSIIFTIYIVEKKMRTDMTFATFASNMGNFYRVFILFAINLWFASNLSYTKRAYYNKRTLVEKYVKDGRDVYYTIFNDSLRMYQTEVQRRDIEPKMDYIVYYENYPEVIHHIDTLRMVEEEEEGR